MTRRGAVAYSDDWARRWRRFQTIAPAVTPAIAAMISVGQS
jgi:hypothetical protein